ncbi:MAG: hypothetical protein DMG73_01210 [Acidobacteria bacterium]|jgi:hypothetical protein|nr:MAG: hypothetical protein DMG75_08115 [Acidobacteriota bacterium]PYX62021.1 MAG: hypothetical protein DMG73_01210 [Acidobacteriota bacterium]PYX65439.1 MAG: hypothetical protein DMG74_08490 [Acidobacteriota bacterium]
MKKCGIILALFFSAAIGSAGTEQTVAELKARVESAREEDRPGICVGIAARQLDAAAKLYTAGNPQEARNAIEDVATFSEKARDAASKSGKKLKPTEIAVRKMAHKLRDMKRTLSFEDQAPVQDAIDRLEHVRTDLLTKMFGIKGEK